MDSTLNLYLIGVALAAIQFLAALPWVIALLVPEGQEIDWGEQLVEPKNLVRNLSCLLGVVIVGVLLAASLSQLREVVSLEWWGRLYGSILHFQLIVDFFLLTLAFLLLVWPKGG